MKLVGFLVSLLFVHEARASEPLRLCAPPLGLAIGGISLADSRSAIVAKLGKPTRVGDYQSEDDGGVYTGSVLFYPHLEINLDGLRGIERIASVGPGARLPYGLKQGMSVQQAADTLHFIRHGVDEDGVAVLPVCESDTDTEVRLHFENGALRSAEIVEYGP